jgi:hypothetical protein
MTHCNQGEDMGRCKYGDDETCPAVAATKSLNERVDRIRELYRSLMREVDLLRVDIVEREWDKMRAQREGMRGFRRVAVMDIATCDGCRARNGALLADVNEISVGCSNEENGCRCVAHPIAG